MTYDEMIEDMKEAAAEQYEGPGPARVAEWLKVLESRPEERKRVLFDSDPFCPKCGHNRDRSSVSSIDNEDGTRSCQMCDALWLEVAPSSVYPSLWCSLWRWLWC